MNCRPAVIVFLSTLALQDVACSDERTKTFDSYQCRYTLPTEEWTWIDKNTVPKAVFAATNGKGLTVALTIDSMPADASMDDKFVKWCEHIFQSHPEIKKRGGRPMRFKSLVCYQSEAELEKDGVKRTMATRYMLANKRAYGLSVIGGADPVEEQNGIAAVFDQFEFTSPPVAPDQSASSTSPFFPAFESSYTFQCLAALSIAFIIRRWYVARSTKSNQTRHDCTRNSP